MIFILWILCLRTIAINNYTIDMEIVRWPSEQRNPSLEARGHDNQQKPCDFQVHGLILLKVYYSSGTD